MEPLSQADVEHFVREGYSIKHVTLNPRLREEALDRCACLANVLTTRCHALMTRPDDQRLTRFNDAHTGCGSTTCRRGCSATTHRPRWAASPRTTAARTTTTAVVASAGSASRSGPKKSCWTWFRGE